MADTSTPPTKRRLQFSLRFLLIAVAAISLAWGLTATWGVHSVATVVAADYRRLRSPESSIDIKEKVELQNARVILSSTADNDGVPVQGHARTVLPFWIHWVWELKIPDDLDARTKKGLKELEPQITEGYDRHYIWFLGFTWRLDEDPKPLGKE